MRINYREELELMRKKFKKRKVRPLKLKKPEWVYNDPMNRIYEEMDILLEYGEVYWGVLVQANEIMFRKEPYIDCPGNVVFTTNEFLNNDPEIMQMVTNEIFSYKNTDDAPEYYQRVVEVITDEMERIFNYPLPLNQINLLKGFPVEFKDEEELLFTTHMFFRDYMPTGVLCSGIFPIVASPKLTRTSIMLPKKYWSKNAIKLFKEQL